MYIDKILWETDAIDSSLRLMDILMDLHFFFFSERKMSLALFRGTQERSLCVKHFWSIGTTIVLIDKHVRNSLIWRMWSKTQCGHIYFQLKFHTLQMFTDKCMLKLPTVFVSSRFHWCGFHSCGFHLYDFHFQNQNFFF